MADTGLKGPFELTDAGITREVLETSAGTYVLDRSHDSGPFHISYVGRADTNLSERLREHLGKYAKRFKFEYYSSAKEAFDKECGLYHDFNPPSVRLKPSGPAKGVRVGLARGASRPARTYRNRALTIPIPPSVETCAKASPGITPVA